MKKKTGKKRATKAKSLSRRTGLRETDPVPGWAIAQSLALGGCLPGDELEAMTVKQALDNHWEWLLLGGVEILADRRLRDVLAKRGITIRKPTKSEQIEANQWVIEGLPSKLMVSRSFIRIYAGPFDAAI